MKKQIAYKSGYNYQLVEDYEIQIAIEPRATIETAFVRLTDEGLLTVKTGYAWDGATDAFDTVTFMRGSLVHDALYGLMRSGYLSEALHRESADRILVDICKEDGMWSVKADLVFRIVRRLAKKAALAESENPILYAPEKVVKNEC